MTSIPSSIDSKVYTIKLPILPIPLTSIVTTGLLAYEGQISPPSTVGSWNTRFRDSYAEYRSIAAEIEIRAVGIYTGETVFFLNEGPALGTPTTSEASQRPSKLVNNNTQILSSNNKIRWKASDFTDLTFLSTSTGYNPFHYYLYTDAANYGSPVTATMLWIVRGTVTVQFRGIGST